MNSRGLGKLFVDNATYLDPERHHAILGQLRRSDRLVLAEPDGYRPSRVVSRHGDIRRIEAQPHMFLNGPRTFLATREEETNRAMAQQTGLALIGRNVVHLAGPDHRVLGSIALQFYAPGHVWKPEDQIAAVVCESIDAMPAQDGSCDFTLAPRHRDTLLKTCIPSRRAAPKQRKVIRYE